MGVSYKVTAWRGEKKCHGGLPSHSSQTTRRQGKKHILRAWAGKVMNLSAAIVPSLTGGEKKSVKALRAERT